MIRRKPFSRAVMALALVATAVWAGTTYTDFLAALAQRESSLRADSENRLTHYVGLYQMGEEAMQDIGLYSGDATSRNDFTGTFSGRYGVSSLADFKGNPDAQTQAVTDYHNRIWNRYLTRGGVGGAADYIGTEMGGVTVTQSGLIAAAHLVGAGAVSAWLASGGAVSPTDAMGTKMTEYLARFAGYTLSPVAPSFTAVATATPTGGAAMVSGAGTYTYTAAPLTPSVSGSAPGAAASVLHSTPAYGARSIGEGFKAATGYEPFEVRDLMVNIAGALLVTWLSYVALSSFASFAAGFTSVIDVGTDIVRAILIAALILMMLN